MKIRNSFLFMLALLVVAGFVACNDDDDDVQPQPETIYEIAAADGRFNSLAAALERTGLDDILDGAGPYTVFAPTDDAFDALGIDVNTVDEGALVDILFYHVLGAEVQSGDIQQGQTYVTTASQNAPDLEQLSMLIEKDGNAVTINGSTSVTAADIDATNGVIHVVDEVIMPMDIVDHAAANENFTSLVGALTSASGDLANVLTGNGPFTVFAPLNSAFDEISDVTATLSPDQLRDVLTYHVVSGNVRSGDLSSGAVGTVNGAEFVVNLGNEVTITDENGNEATVVLTDVQATNGVIHVLNKVIIPQL